MFRTRRIISLLLALVMTFAAGGSALAVGEGLFSFFDKKEDEVTISEPEDNFFVSINDYLVSIWEYLRGK